MHRIVADELIPALRAEPGFAGALSLVNPRTAEGMMIVLWQSAEQAQRPFPGTSTRDRQPTSVWEVALRV